MKPKSRGYAEGWKDAMQSVLEALDTLKMPTPGTVEKMAVAKPQRRAVSAGKRARPRRKE